MWCGLGVRKGTSFLFGTFPSLTQSTPHMVSPFIERALRAENDHLRSLRSHAEVGEWKSSGKCDAKFTIWDLGCLRTKCQT
jgi:hypothetical protein